MPDGNHYTDAARAEDRRSAEIAAWIAGDSSGRFTLRRLQIFWTVAHFGSLTKAAKQLGLTQPTLSQQIASLEEVVGTPLFERRSNQLHLSEAGRHLLRKAEVVLDGIQSLEDSVVEIGKGLRQTVSLAGLDSVLRVLLPPAMALLHETFPQVDYDIHECAPADVVEMLHGRRVQVGLVAANSIAPASTGFREVPVYADPYVLAVPASLDLERVADPLRDLAPEALATLRRSIQFVFGTQHSQRVQAWYDAVIPGNWPYARVRSFELALAMVRAGQGVCLAPALSGRIGDGLIDGIRYYGVDLPAREIVALLPARSADQQPLAALVAALRSVGSRLAPPPLLDIPPFLRG